MTKFRNLGILLMVFALFVATSCEDDDNGGTIESQGTVVDIVNANGPLTNLRAALQTASGDLVGTLNGSGPFTLFAPSNSAFGDLADELGFESAGDLLTEINPALLSEILTYHVVAGENGAESLNDGTTLTTVFGDELTVAVSEDGDIQLLDSTKLPQTQSVATVTASNPAATNGIVHFVDKVLLPQKAIEALSIDIRPTILDLATNTEDLSTLVSALGKANLVGTITGLDSASVLAPTNQAFENLLDALGGDYNSLDDFDNEVELSLLSNILTYHVLTTRVGSANLMAGEVETALQDNTVEVVAENGGFTFGDAMDTNAGIVTADIDAKNGVIHIIDKVLLPQEALDFIELLGSDDLATVVTETPQLSVLEEALSATGLVDTFVDATNESFVQEEDESDEDFEKRRTPANFTYFKPATVFAPSDTAFSDLFAALGDDYTDIASFDTESELALLTEILLYHVVSGEVTSADLSAGSVTTAAESDIEIIAAIGTGDFVIGDASNDINANIVTFDVQARNGVAHIIDKVLLPESAVTLIQSMTNEEEDDN